MTATRGLQNRSADGRWLQTSQVTRHYLGYHGANDLPNGGVETCNAQFLEDQQFPVYSAFQVWTKFSFPFCLRAYSGILWNECPRLFIVR